MIISLLSTIHGPYLFTFFPLQKWKCSIKCDNNVSRLDNVNHFHIPHAYHKEILNHHSFHLKVSLLGVLVYRMWSLISSPRAIWLSVWSNSMFTISPKPLSMQMVAQLKESGRNRQSKNRWFFFVLHNILDLTPFSFLNRSVGTSSICIQLMSTVWDVFLFRYLMKIPQFYSIIIV